MFLYSICACTYFVFICSARSHAYHYMQLFMFYFVAPCMCVLRTFWLRSHFARYDAMSPPCLCITHVHCAFVFLLRSHSCGLTHRTQWTSTHAQHGTLFYGSSEVQYLVQHLTVVMQLEFQCYGCVLSVFLLLLIALSCLHTHTLFASAVRRKCLRVWIIVCCLSQWCRVNSVARISHAHHIRFQYWNGN